MANRFWVGGTGTWDAATTTNWAATSGGAGGQSVPGSGDAVIFDASSGGGTVTVNFGGLITIQSLTMGAFTGTLDFATNNNSITLTASGGFSGTGTGIRTFNMGDGTWTLSDNATIWNLATVTNLTFNANGSTLAFTGTGGTTSRRFTGGGRTYNVVTVASGTAAFLASGANTIATLTIAAGNRVAFPSGTTTTITTLTGISGSGSTPTLFYGDNPTNGAATISSANNFTLDYGGMSGMTFSGGGTFAANNSYDFGGNTGITITAPSGGGATVVGVIGG